MTAINISYDWIPEDIEAIANPQNVLEDGLINLNGKLARLNNVNLANYGFRRNITITSSQNLTGTSSVVRGMVNGGIVTEEIDNPNDDTIGGNVAFDSIIDITVTGGDVEDISVGIGTIGFFNPINVNTNAATLSSSTIQLILYSGTITYSIYQTADTGISNYGISFDTLIGNGTYQVVEDAAGNELENLTESTIFNNSPPMLNASFLVKIVNSSATARFKLIYMQL
jgi:hypothetical protein